MKNLKDDRVILTNLIPQFKDFNFGIILISFYLLFEFGSVQGLYPLVNIIKLPFIISLLILLYAIYLIVLFKFNFQSRTTKAYFIFCLFTIIYSLVSTKNFLAKEDLIKLFIIFFSNYIVLTASINRLSQLLLIINIWIFSVFFSSYHGIMQGGLVWGNKWLKDPNHISLLAAMMLPFAFMLLFLHKNKIMKFFYASCLLLFISVNVIAASRGGVLGMILACFLLWLLEKNKLRNLLIIIFVLISIIAYAPPKLFKEMNTLHQGTKEETADDRIYLWGLGLKMFYDSPIFGVGLVNYPYYFSEYEKQVRYSPNVWRVPHSTPIQWLSETGLFGLFILFLLQKNLFMNWYFVYKKKKFLLAFDDNYKLLYTLAQCIGISQIVFWFCAFFLSLLPYPFYWILIPLSESSYKLLDNQV